MGHLVGDWLVPVGRMAGAAGAELAGTKRPTYVSIIFSLRVLACPTET
jgi:hypothetical protein